MSKVLFVYVGGGEENGTNKEIFVVKKRWSRGSIKLKLLIMNNIKLIR